MGLAWLSSIPLTSTFRGCFLAHAIHVLAPGSASNLAAAIGWLHNAQSFRGRFVA